MPSFQESIIPFLLGGAAVALLGLFLYFLNPSLFCKPQQKIQFEEPKQEQELIEDPEVAQAIYGTEQVSGRYGNVVGQIYAVFVVAIITSILVFILNNRFVRELQKETRKLGSKVQKKLNL